MTRFLLVAAILVVLLFFAGTLIAAIVHADAPWRYESVNEGLFRPVMLPSAVAEDAAPSAPGHGASSPPPPRLSPSATAIPTPTAVPAAEPVIVPSRSGTASWYPARGMIAAVHSWRFGDAPYRLTICASRCIVVTVQDYCQGCVGPRLVDLSDDAFSLLAPLSQGIVRIEVQG